MTLSFFAEILYDYAIKKSEATYMHANSHCMACIRRKQKQAATHCQSEQEQTAYLTEVEHILEQYGKTESSPWLAEKIDAMQKRFWDDTEDFAKLKHKYNQLLLSQEEVLVQQIRNADDPVRECIKYVCAANYIDFAAVDCVTENTLSRLMKKAEEEQVPQGEYDLFCRDLKQADTLVYLTDNCGEIVLDKIFMRFLRETYPNLHITAMVRGQAVINDATMEDAEEVGLTQVVPCLGSGSACPGTVLSRLSDEARKTLLEADMVISKGQGNFEALYGEGVNPYYLFLCKCDLFVRRFGLRQFSSVFQKEERMELKEDVE